jgi:hypothetical protein
MIKTILFGLEYFMRSIFKKEKLIVKLISLSLFFVISIINILVIVRLIVYREM